MTAVTAVDDRLLAEWPLPAIDGETDKEARGRVLVIGGSREIPGGAVLAGLAALRAGAGKLVVATPQSAWSVVAAALPEARVIALPEAPGGGPLEQGLAAFERMRHRVAAVVIGPGMMDREVTTAFVRGALRLFDRSRIVLDALAMDVVLGVKRFQGPVLLTPHAGEMAHLSGEEKAAILADPLDAALRHARAWHALVALKGPTTCIADSTGRAWRHEACTPGLATSGSGDVLAGLVAGLAARGASLQQAAVWGVALHAKAGARLAQRAGSLGFLARELPPEVPALLDETRRGA